MESQIVLTKSPPLCGKVRIGGAKNSALPIIAASLLLEGETKIKDVPCLSDIYSMISLLEIFGAKTSFNKNELVICADKILSAAAPYELVSRLRASFLVMGPLLAKTGKVEISMPGGCAIGTRPVDLHLKGFIAMGAKITKGHGFIKAYAKELKGTKIYLDFPSVGATENILMAACLAKGQTIIENAAIEPEIVDLANFLNKAGAKIKGAGTNAIKITGVDSLKAVNYKVIPDRIEAGTFMLASAITGGSIELSNIVTEHLKPVCAKLKEIGAEVIIKDNKLIVNGCLKRKATDIKTLPFPGFPTDMQAPFTSLLTVVEGTSLVIETIFENRFMHLAQMQRMGANIKIEGKAAIICGVKKLTGADVCASDLRAGAALVLAGLVAEGETVISNAQYIDRGYENFAEKLSVLGANIKKINL